MGQVQAGETRLEPFMTARKVHADGSLGPVVDVNASLPFAGNAWLALANACAAIARALLALSRKV